MHFLFDLSLRYCSILSKLAQWVSGCEVLIQRPITGKVVFFGYSIILYDLSMLRGPHFSPLFSITLES